MRPEDWMSMSAFCVMAAVAFGCASIRFDARRTPDVTLALIGCLFGTAAVVTSFMGVAGL